MTWIKQHVDKKTVLFTVCMGVVALVLLQLLAFGTLVLLDSCEDSTSYYTSTQWSCTDAQFMDEYRLYCEETVRETVAEHGLSCEMSVVPSEPNVFYVYLYDDTFTMKLFFANRNEGDYGAYQINVYLYGDTASGLSDEDARVLALANALTDALAFDTKTDQNRLVTLYEQMQQSGDTYASDHYHFDHIVGNVGYYVARNYDGGYYYRLGFDSSVDKRCTNARFEGLLKPWDMDGAGDVFFGEHTYDDTAPLGSVLTVEYDLDELKAFFEPAHTNELGDEATVLTFREVHQAFPVEIVRSDGYSVYKVRQGGYYYVFWGTSVSYADMQRQDAEPCVYFSAYLSSDRSLADVQSITAGVSTAEDVRSLDPSLEMSFVRSVGTFSYSYLNRDTLLEIEYEPTGDVRNTETLVVKDIQVISRSSATSRFSPMLPTDLP